MYSKVPDNWGGGWGSGNNWKLEKFLNNNSQRKLENRNDVYFHELLSYNFS